MTTLSLDRPPAFCWASMASLMCTSCQGKRREERENQRERKGTDARNQACFVRQPWWPKIGRRGSTTPTHLFFLLFHAGGQDGHAAADMRRFGHNIGVVCLAVDGHGAANVQLLVAVGILAGARHCWRCGGKCWAALIKIAGAIRNLLWDQPRTRAAPGPVRVAKGRVKWGKKRGVQQRVSKSTEKNISSSPAAPVGSDWLTWKIAETWPWPAAGSLATGPTGRAARKCCEKRAAAEAGLGRALGAQWTAKVFFFFSLELWVQ